ncbi:MAG: SMP-30/gluconolactonase/LRE family protein [Burkholderiaceae bacterium]
MTGTATPPAVDAVFPVPMGTGESPLWHPDHAALYWIDIPGCTVHRLHPASGVHRAWPLPAEPGCIACGADGDSLIVALRTGIARLDLKDGALDMLAAAPYDTATTRFNDGRCDPAGRLVVGTLYEPRDRAGATLYQFDIDGGLRSLADAVHPVTVSNGVAFGDGGRTLYHSDTSAHITRAYDYDPATGAVGAPRTLRAYPSDKTAPGYGGRPDGGAVDSENAYWSALFEGGRLLRLSPSGEILREIPLPVRCPTMMAFGGDDLRTLYVTSASRNRPAEELARLPLSGCVLSLRVDVPGRIEPAFRG